MFLKYKIKRYSADVDIDLFYREGKGFEDESLEKEQEMIER